MERLEKILNRSQIFNYFRMEDNVHKELQKAVYNITINSLLSKLSNEHKKLLLYTHFHQSDPNDYTPGEDVTLLERLINDACFFSMSSPDFPLSTNLSIGNTQLLTGMSSKEILSKYIDEINEIWQKDNIAKIQYINEELIFEIILKKSNLVISQ